MRRSVSHRYAGTKSNAGMPRATASPAATKAATTKAAATRRKAPPQPAATLHARGGGAAQRGNWRRGGAHRRGRSTAPSMRCTGAPRCCRRRHRQCRSRAGAAWEPHNAAGSGRGNNAAALPVAVHTHRTRRTRRILK